MKGRLEVSYKSSKGEKVLFYSEELQMTSALLIAEDLQKNKKMQVQFVDYRESSWSIKDMTKYLEEVEGEPHQVIVYFDGGFDKETSRAGLGAVIYLEQSGRKFRMRKNLLMRNIYSNNEAEYAALFFAVEELQRLGVHHLPITCMGDSQVVINQLLGEWAVMDRGLNEWADKVEAAMQGSGLEAEYELISRKENQEADQLASQALQGIDIYSEKELET